MKLLRKLPDKAYISLQFFKRFKRFPNLKSPKTFNEKLQWLKLNDRREVYTEMVDKYEAKEYVSRLIGEEYVIPNLGVWDSPEQIDFDTLPQSFVLKWNHDSGSVIVCKDKSRLDRAAVVERLAKYKDHNGYWYGREWPYKNIKPKIIAEQFLDAGDEGLIDYKFYCFGGEPRFLYVSKGLENHETASISFLTLDWKFAPYERTDFKPFSELPQKPSRFDQMVKLAKILSEGHDFLRVDLYQVEERIYFSELTFYPCAGYMPFANPEHDLEVGQMLTLNTKKQAK